jgi:HNH endonuclease
MAHPSHEHVRLRYQRCCGYCGVSEAETGGELTVDHFQPVSAGGDESDNNLVYACFRCNSYKADFFPSTEDGQHGRRILHPLLDSVTVHLRENLQTGHLEPVTDTGRFHIAVLRLNRPQLIDRRLTHRLFHLLSEADQLLRSENEGLRFRLVVLETYLRELNRRQAEEAGEQGPEPPS